MAERLIAVPTVVDFTACLEQGEFSYGIVSATGIALRDEVSESEWRTLTQNVCLMWEATGVKHVQARFMLGDLYRWGEERFGERYADLIDTSRAYIKVREKTISNMMWIAGKVAPSRRHENLSLAHHEAVAKLEADEQNEFLKLAEDEAQTVKELRASIRERHPTKPRANKPKVTVSIDTDNPSAVTDALQILANHLSNPKTKWNEDWTEHTATIRSEHMRRMKRKMG